MTPSTPTTVLQDVAALARSWRALSGSRDGDGGPVVLIPGFFGPEASMGAVGRLLTARGHDVHGWGAGINLGGWDRFRQVRDRVQRLHARTGRPVAIVGWSWGGVYAREVARDLPDAVRQVVTLGSPVVGGARHTSLADFTERWMGADHEAGDRFFEARRAVPLVTPVTALVTPHDAVVPWHAAIDPWYPQVEHVEVQCTHMGLVVHPPALACVAARLSVDAASGRDAS